jgi:IMP dehydrogenase
VQEIYKEPFKEKLVAQRVKEIKAGGALCAVSSIPQNAEKVGKIAADAGADLFVVQGTVDHGPVQVVERAGGGPG